jgi:hypothetical protein
MRFRKAAFRPAHISRRPRVSRLVQINRHPRVSRLAQISSRPRISLLALSLAGFLGCIFCLAWNVLHDRRQPEQPPDRFGFGKPATQHEIDSEAIAIAPDGLGLPPGKGDSTTGAQVYKMKCAACHGLTGREGPFQKLVSDTSKAKTIGNFWPYATTVFDYIRRAMPLNAPGTLNADEVYGLTAYLLSANKIIPRETVLDAHTLPAVEMPAKNLFETDPRQ